MPKITFVNEGITIEVPFGANLRKVAMEHGINLYPPLMRLLNCRGHGLCGTCRVKVLPEENLSPRTRAERRELQGLEPYHHRLACQTLVQGEITVVTHPRKPLGWMNHPLYTHLKEDA